MITAVIRYPLLFILKILGKLDSLLDRANRTEIGFTGHVSAIDQAIIEEKQLKSLNRFERWLLKPIIEAEQKRRRKCFKEAVLEVTGEDPADWEIR